MEWLFVSYLSANPGSQKEGRSSTYCGWFWQPRQSTVDWSSTGLTRDVSSWCWQLYYEWHLGIKIPPLVSWQLKNLRLKWKHSSQCLNELLEYFGPDWASIRFVQLWFSIQFWIDIQHPGSTELQWKKKSWIGSKVQSSITSEEKILVKVFLIIHVPMIVLPNQKQEGKSLFFFPTVWNSVLIFGTRQRELFFH